MAYITLDFGSSNSGAVLNTAFGNEYNPAELIYVHRQDGDSGFTKQPTVFWIKRSLLEQSFISENDINIFSCVFHDDNEYAASANFIWCQNEVEKSLPKLSNNCEWVRIQYPKMELYKTGNNNPANTIIKASDGSRFPLNKILKLFFMVIKKECKHRALEAGLVLGEDDINWGITVPGLAIWNQDAVKVIKDIGHSVFGEKLTLFSEPECALIGINISGNAELDFVKDRYSLIADLGGGTADICVMKETLNEDGVISFDEIKSTSEGKDSTTSERAGGNDIDLRFKSFLCEYLAEGTDMNDTPILLYTNFLKDNPAGAMKFDKRWHSLQFSEDIEEETIHFHPGRAYIEWLKTHCAAAARKIDEYGYFTLNGKKLRNYVFDPIYKVILKSIEDNLSVLKQKGINLDAIYFAGGLSLDRRLKKQIKALSSKYFPYAKHKETSDGSVVGAVQRGGNHIAANKETLIRRMSRRAFYVEFVMAFSGDTNELRDSLGERLRQNYYEHLGIRLSDDEIERILDEQWSNLSIDYSESKVCYFSPLCLRFAPVTRIQSFSVLPFHQGEQTGMAVRIYSSDKNFLLFKNDDAKDEGEFVHDFGYNWENANLIFDPTSSAVEGTALFYLSDNNGNRLKEFVIQNVSKRGI